MHRRRLQPPAPSSAHIRGLRPGLTGLVLALVLAGCAEMPDLGAKAPLSTGGTPALLPMDELARLTPTTRTDAESSAPLTARALRLQERAKAMRAPVLDPATRDRLSGAAGG